MLTVKYWQRANAQYSGIELVLDQNIHAVKNALVATPYSHKTKLFTNTENNCELQKNCWNGRSTL